MPMFEEGEKSLLKSLVASILQFLQDQLQSSLLAADAKESLEVAIHCLETVFGVKCNDSSTAGLLPSCSLLDIFRELVRSERPLIVTVTEPLENPELHCQDSLMPKQIKEETQKSFSPTVIQNGSWYMEEASSNELDQRQSSEQPLALTVKEKDRINSDLRSTAEFPPLLLNGPQTIDVVNFNEPIRPLDLSRVTSKHSLERLPPKGGCVQCGREGRLTKRGRPHESYFGCKLCKVHLCRKRNCFEVWHTVC